MLGGKCVWPTTISTATLEMCFINIPSTIQKHVFQFEHDNHVLSVTVNLKAFKYFADVVIINRGAEMGGGGAPESGRGAKVVVRPEPLAKEGAQKIKQGPQHRKWTVKCKIQRSGFSKIYYNLFEKT